MEIALAVLVIAAIAKARRGNSAPQTELPSGSGKAPEPEVKGPGGVVGAIAGGAGFLVKTLGGSGAAPGAVATTASASSKAVTTSIVVGSTILGVSTGFVIVAGLWAVLAIASAIVSGVIAPEMTTRATWPKLFSSAPGSLAWRAARSMWARLVAARLGAPWNVQWQKYPPLDTGYGDITVQGYLDFLVGPATPGNRPSDPFAFYEFLEWFRARRVEIATEEQAKIISDAQWIARAYGTGLACGAAACGAAAGKSVGQPPLMGTLSFDGLGLTASEPVERNFFQPTRPPASELVGAYLTGALEGVATSTKVAFSEGGKPYLTSNLIFAVAARIAEWGADFGKLTSDGAVIEGEGNRVQVTFDGKVNQPETRLESYTTTVTTIAAKPVAEKAEPPKVALGGAGVKGF